jgi:acyl-CoA dehydrogenase
VITFNQSYDMPALQAAMFAKVTATQNSVDVASDAIQMHGGNGLTHVYGTEKIFRDARASLIEDGCNEVLSIKGGTMLVDDDLL